MKNFFYFQRFLVTILLVSLVWGCKKDAEPVVPGYQACITLPDASALRANELLSFASCSTNASSFAWDFGDGSTSTEASPKHAYAREGKYTVKLTVSDGKNTTTSSKEITIMPSQCETHRGFISQNQTWKKGCHIVENSINVIEGATLTIEPGAVVKFKTAASIEVAFAQNSNIIAEGTATEPILFTSFSATPAPGNWDNISVGGYTPVPASFKYCVFEYGGFDMFDDPSAMLRIYDGGRVKVDHCEFRKSLSYAVELENDSKFELFTNNNIHDINTFAMYISGNNAGSIGEGNVITSKGVLVSLHQVTQNAEWRGLTCPYVTESHLWVGSDTGNTLTFGPGVRIEFQGGQMLRPYHSTSIATLISNGTAANPVVLTAHDPSAAEKWGGVALSNRFTANTFFRHTIFEHAQNGRESNSVIAVGATTLNMENCKISGATQYGIYMGSGAQLGVFTGNDFGNTNAYSIYLWVQNLTQVGNGNTFSGNKNAYCAFNEIKENIVWPDLPVYYELTSDLYIGSKAGNPVTVTMEPGTKVLLAVCTINIAQAYDNGTAAATPATLIAVGTASNPIVFEEKPITSATVGHRDLINYDGNDTRADNVLAYCKMIGGTMGVRVSNIYNTATNMYPTIRNCTISNCQSAAIYVANSYPLISNNTYTGNGTNGPRYQ
jgi:PKD repeat protein